MRRGAPVARSAASRRTRPQGLREAAEGRAEAAAGLAPRVQLGGDETVGRSRLQSAVTAALFPDKANAPPTSRPRWRGTARRALGQPGLGRSVRLPEAVRPGARGPGQRLRRASRYAAAAGGERGPRGAVPLSPRAAAFVSPQMR